MLKRTINLVSNNTTPPNPTIHHFSPAITTIAITITTMIQAKQGKIAKTAKNHIEIASTTILMIIMTITT